MRGKFLIFLIFLVILGLGLWNWQKNLFSKESLKLEILGPKEVTAFEEFEYIVKYKNTGKFRLEEPRLVFEYPKHSLLEKSKSQREELGPEKLGQAIYPGQEKILHFKARLLGEKGEVKIAKASLSFRPKNLKARYELTTTFATKIKEVPLTFEFDLPSKVESGKKFKLILNYFSNLDYPLSNLKCQIEYPLGFEFIESHPPSLEKNEWEIGVLNKTERGRIEVLGKLEGEVGEEKIFRAKLGLWQEGEFILLKETFKGTEIIQPSLSITQQINGKAEFVASPGDWLHYQIFFKNIGKEPLNNLFLISKLKGKAFDFQTLKAPQGEFEIGDNSIVFDWRKIPKLQFLEPGEEGEVEFWIKLKDEWPILGPEDKNPVIKNEVYLSEVKEEFITKVNSKLVISQKGYFEDEIFGNSGPLPPKVGKVTTYTILWQVKNYYNDVKEVKVKAKLPKNVELTGKIFPQEEEKKFTFDSDSREIVWQVGDLRVSEGLAETFAPNIAFQIKFKPERNQIGKTPNLIGEAKITGEDTWTRVNLEAVAPPINTTLPDDPTVSEEMGVVR